MIIASRVKMKFIALNVRRVSQTKKVNAFVMDANVVLVSTSQNIYPSV